MNSDFEIKQENCKFITKNLLKLPVNLLQIDINIKLILILYFSS